MVIAALASFGALFVAWILAPSETRSMPAQTQELSEGEGLPVAA